MEDGKLRTFTPADVEAARKRYAEMCVSLITEGYGLRAKFIDGDNYCFSTYRHWSNGRVLRLVRIANEVYLYRKNRLLKSELCKGV